MIKAFALSKHLLRQCGRCCFDIIGDNPIEYYDCFGKYDDLLILNVLRFF